MPESCLCDKSGRCGPAQETAPQYSPSILPTQHLTFTLFHLPDHPLPWPKRGRGEQRAATPNTQGELNTGEG